MSATSPGPARSETINHAAPTFCMKVPISETRFAISRWRKIGTRSGRPKPAEARTARFCFVSVDNRVLERIKSDLGGLCFFITERCNFSFRFCRVRFGRRLECKLTRTSGYLSPQCTQLLGQLRVLS